MSLLALDERGVTRVRTPYPRSATMTPLELRCRLVAR